MRKDVLVLLLVLSLVVSCKTSPPTPPLEKRGGEPLPDKQGGI